jgi:hypothetical protein
MDRQTNIAVKVCSMIGCRIKLGTMDRSNLIMPQTATIEPQARVGIKYREARSAGTRQTKTNIASADAANAAMSILPVSGDLIKNTVAAINPIVQGNPKSVTKDFAKFTNAVLL